MGTEGVQKRLPGGGFWRQLAVGVGWRGALSREPGKNSASGNILTAAEGFPAGETSSLPKELGPRPETVWGSPAPGRRLSPWQLQTCWMKQSCWHTGQARGSLVEQKASDQGPIPESELGKLPGVSEHQRLPLSRQARVKVRIDLTVYVRGLALGRCSASANGSSPGAPTGWGGRSRTGNPTPAHRGQRQGWLQPRPAAFHWIRVGFLPLCS